MSERFGSDFRDVRVHTGQDADRAARALGARAYTVGRDVGFARGEFAPGTASGERLLAHELAHVADAEAGAGEPMVRRETPAEFKSRHEDLWGLNLREDDLGRSLAAEARAGRFAFALRVFDEVEWYNRDEVAAAMMDSLLGGSGAQSAAEVIRIAHAPGGGAFLSTVYDYIDWWWASEVRLSRLVAAVLDHPGSRGQWNVGRIIEVKAEATSDLDALARMFDDPLIIDDGTVTSRLESILSATGHIAVPGLQTGVDFSDTGFAGDQEHGGEGFRDPHPSSRNQPGHFLTAVGLQFSPGVVSRPIPLFGTVREMVRAPETMPDAEVALRLTIGHEKAPDPNGTMAALSVVLTGVVESLVPGPPGETEEQRNERIGRAVLAETQRQIDEIIGAFRTQFHACTDADVEAWNEAIAAMGTGPRLDMAAAEPALARIAIDPTMRGNSIQDLRLSAVGWRLGQLLSAGEFATNADVAAWIRRNLGAPAAAPP